jgi:hypothetical protein
LDSKKIKENYMANKKTKVLISFLSLHRTEQHVLEVSIESRAQTLHMVAREILAGGLRHGCNNARHDT